MEVTFKKMVSQIPVRFAEMIVKLLSVKGVILGLTVWLTLKDVFDPWATVTVFLVVIFGREALKLADKMRG